MTMQPEVSASSFLKRSEEAAHPMAAKLLRLIAEKKTNLCLACDAVRQVDLLKWADAIGPEICVLKTHIDILEDFTPDCTKRLRDLADKHRFLIFEDRKFADIGQTAALQFAGGIYRIAEWADLINAHIVSGPGIIDSLKQIGKPKGCGLLLLAEMSTFETMAKGSYAKRALDLGEAHADFVCGFISLRKLSRQAGMIHFTPGVKFEKGKDALGQRYRTLDEILVKNQSDVVIVGRDIMQAKDPASAAALYREKAFYALP